MTRPKAYSYLRMSTDLQLKGDSRRRQMQMSQSYADEYGLQLADDAQLEDIGISAFKGANAKEGALGKFLAAVSNGDVEPGSYLLVESLDRLSREELLKANALFLSIVQSGIKLVTLEDNRVYTAENLNIVDMITSLVIMEKANAESKSKSLRVGAAWRNKKDLAKASRKPMTARCPAWLKLSPDRTTYEVIPERVEIVRQIFEDTIGGLGMFAVSTRLNKTNVPAFEGKNGWHRSYIAKTLTNRAVLGEFQPGRKLDGRRVADGDPILNYYPAIVSEEVFYQANYSRSRRRIGGAGRKGPGYANLFGGIARCAYCNSQVVFENKGSGTKGGSYLVCGSAQRGWECSTIRWKYSDFEASFLASVPELDLESILNSDADAKARKDVEGELAALRGEVASVDALMEKTYELLAADAAPDFVGGKLKELTAKRATLTDRIALSEDRQAELLSKDARFYSSKEEIGELVHQLQGPASDELYKVRAKIASRLRVLVETLIVAPQGHAPQILQHDARTVGKLSAEVIEHMTLVARRPIHARRYFAIRLKDATARLIYPKHGDPLSYDVQIDEEKRGSRFSFKI